MQRVGVRFYGELASALVGEGEALGGSPERAIQIAVGLLGSGSPHLALLHRASGIALLRLGDPDAARRELNLGLEAARAGGEGYEVASALGALGAVGALDAAQAAERDELLARLGVVGLPAIADDVHGLSGESVTALVTSPAPA
jgi:hypothetical protein